MSKIATYAVRALADALELQRTPTNFDPSTYAGANRFRMLVDVEKGLFARAARLAKREGRDMYQRDAIETSDEILAARKQDRVHLAERYRQRIAKRAERELAITA